VAVGTSIVLTMLINTISPHAYNVGYSAFPLLKLCSPIIFIHGLILVQCFVIDHVAASLETEAP
jgi:hypothetical protein